MLTEEDRLAVAGSTARRKRAEEWTGWGVGNKGLETGGVGGPGRARPRLDFLPFSHAPFHAASILDGEIYLKGLKGGISPGCHLSRV